VLVLGFGECGRVGGWVPVEMFWMLVTRRIRLLVEWLTGRRVSRAYPTKDSTSLISSMGSYSSRMFSERISAFLRLRSAIMSGWISGKRMNSHNSSCVEKVE